MTCQLIQGDCLEKMKDIKDNSIDFICTDLPYGITSCDWDKTIPFNKYIRFNSKIMYENEYIMYRIKEGLTYIEAIEEFNSLAKKGMWCHLKRIIKDNGCIALFGSEPFSSHLRMSNIKQYKYDWIWNKKRGGCVFNAKLKPMTITENIVIFSNGNTSNGNLNNMFYSPIMKDAKKENIRPENKGSIMGVAIYDHLKNKKSAKSAKDYNIKKRYPNNIINISSYTSECNSTKRQHPPKNQLNF